MTCIRHLIPIALMTSLAAVPAVAANSGKDAPRRTTVGYADLNLGTPEGVAALDRRIARAIDHVCSGGFNSSLDTRREARRCGNDAMLIVQPQRARVLASAEKKPIQFGARQR